MCGKYQKGRQNVKTPNSGKRTRAGRRGGGQAGGVGEWVTVTEGGTRRMSTGCYSVCWQTEHQ